jgi:hypothetical protein
MNKLFPTIKSEIDKTQAILLQLAKLGLDLKDVRIGFFESFEKLYANFYRVRSYIRSPEFEKDSEQIYFNNPLCG